MPLFDRMDDESARDRLLIAMHTRECAGLLGTVPQVTHTCLTVAFVFEELEMHAYAMQMMQGVLRLAQRAFGEHDMWVAKMHHSTGLMQVSVGDAAGALASFKASRAVLLAQPSPSLAHLVPVTNDVAVEAFKLKQYDEALQAYRDTRVYLEQQITTDGRPSVRMAQLLHDTAVVLHDKGAEHEAEAMQLYRDSLALHRAAGNNRSEALARCLRDKSRLHRSRQEVSDALSALEDALQTIQEISDDDVSRLLVDVLAERGEILFGLQRNVEAKDMFLQAISVASGWADEGL
jgi:tetratricopeptide (TPR) repeat protein